MASPSFAAAAGGPELAWQLELRGPQVDPPTATPSATPNPSGNRLANPGAEEPTSDPVVLPGWTSGSLDGPLPRIDPGDHIPSPPNRSGNHRFGVGVGWQTVNSYMYQQVAVAPGYEYRPALWLSHGDGTDEEIVMSWIDGPWGGTEQQLYVSGAAAEPTWRLYSGKRIVPNSPTVTIVLRFHHWWATNKAGMHVDDLELIGPDPALVTPIPTRTPTPTVTRTATMTPVLTWTQTPTVPPLGGERLVNGGFEGSFVDGVAEGWSGFAVLPGGRAKENAKLGRIGGGVYGARRWNAAEGSWDEDVQSIRLSGKTNLVDWGRLGLITHMQEELGDDVITVAKYHAETWLADRGYVIGTGDSYAYGLEYADWLHLKSAQSGHWGHCYYGLNEPDVNSVAGTRAAALFEKGMTVGLQAHGMRSCVLNNSTGTPAPIDNCLIGEVRDLFDIADYVGYHCYGGPTEELMCAPTSLTYFSLRWRQIASRYNARHWSYPAVIYTEATTWGGWIGRFSKEAVRDDLICHASNMRQDPWSLGLCIFVTGCWPDQTWAAWDVAQYHDVIDALRAHNQANPVDARSGGKSQQLQVNDQTMDRGVVQVVSSAPGATYLLQAWTKLEWFSGQDAPYGHAIGVRLGFDPTGQTADPNAPTVQWSPELAGPGMFTDIWYKSQLTVQATGAQASVWLRAAHPKSRPSVRVSFDDVSLRLIP